MNELCSIIISTCKDLCSIFMHDHVQKMHMSIWIMKVYEHKKIRSLYLEAVIWRLWDPSTLEAHGQMRSLYLEDMWSDEIPLFWRHVVRRDPFNLEAYGQNDIPPSREAHESPCRLALCDEGHELSSLPDQATQG